MAAVEADRMTTPMPECPQYENMFSGYLDIGEGKKHHYVYVESQGNPETDPLLFWFNGGPGCSSMIGFIQEHGPCVFMDDSDALPQDNPYSWTKNSSIVYLESPAGVGYNEFSGKFAFNDTNVSYDNLASVLAFFEAFPELKDKDLYLSGESYAGIYIPYLALRILEHNNATEPENAVNLVGVAIGNGVTNWNYDCLPALMDMAFAHGLIDSKLNEEIKASGCDWAWVDFEPLTPKCQALMDRVDEDMKNIYPYDLYRPTEESYGKKSMKQSVKAHLVDDSEEEKRLT